MALVPQTDLKYELAIDEDLPLVRLCCAVYGWKNPPYPQDFWCDTKAVVKVQRHLRADGPATLSYALGEWHRKRGGDPYAGMDEATWNAMFHSPNRNLTFCRLFWGTLGLVPIGAVLAVLSPLVLLAWLLVRNKDSLRDAAHRVQGRLTGGVERASASGTRGVMALQRVAAPLLVPAAKPTGRALRLLAVPLLVALGFAGEALFFALGQAWRRVWRAALLLVTLSLGYWTVGALIQTPGSVWAQVGVAVGIALGVALALPGLVRVVPRVRGPARVALRGLERCGNGVVFVGATAARPVFVPLLRGSRWFAYTTGMTSWELFTTAYRAVKTNTCPRVSSCGPWKKERGCMRNSMTQTTSRSLDRSAFPRGTAGLAVGLVAGTLFGHLLLGAAVTLCVLFALGALAVWAVRR